MANPALVCLFAAVAAGRQTAPNSICRSAGPGARANIARYALAVISVNYGGRSDEIADDSYNLFRNNVMDHVPCAGYPGERASRQFRSESPGATIAVDDLVTADRHNRDEERQFGMVLRQTRRTRDHQGSFPGTGSDL